jgi:hypothetical protein
MASDKTKEFQERTRELLLAQQEAYLAAVKRWRDGLQAGAQPPPWPKSPPLDTLPSPAEVAEASYSFAAKLLADQSRFMEELGRAMANPEKKT